MEEQISFFSLFADRLSRLGIDYMITGSAAGVVFGEPRLTHDIDIVLRLSHKTVDQFLGLFPEIEFYVPPKEIVIQEMMRRTRGHINIIHHQTGFKADFYFSGSEELQKWGLENRVPIDLGSSKIYFAPIEYVILFKLRYFREGGSEKHRRDITGLLKVSREKINIQLLTEMAKQLNLEEQLRPLLAEQ